MSPTRLRWRPAHGFLACVRVRAYESHSQLAPAFGASMSRKTAGAGVPRPCARVLAHFRFSVVVAPI
jgi:hypothetical protein